MGVDPATGSKPDGSAPLAASFPRQEQTFDRLRVITSVQIGARKLRLQIKLYHYLIRIPGLGVRSMPGINLRLFGWLK